MEKPLKIKRKYTDEQYRKDKKKLIGVGLLILALFFVLLTFWHRDRFADRRIDRERQAIEREKGVMPDMAMPALDLGEMMEKAGIDDILKDLGKEVPPKKHSFQNFIISLPTTIEEILENQEFENNIEQLLDQYVSIKFFGQNFDKNLIKKQLLEQFMKQEQQEKIPELDVDIIGMLPSFFLFTIIELQEINNLTDCSSLLKSIEKKDGKDFEIIEKKIIEETENEIRLMTTFRIKLEMEGQMPQTRFYSYKKLRIINDNAYLFAFLSLVEIDKNAQKELDNILKSVIIK